ncbi:MAG: hypothetical protein U1F34_07065 [Gammaproteobacteria bacterium]
MTRITVEGNGCQRIGNDGATGLHRQNAVLSQQCVIELLGILAPLSGAESTGWRNSSDSTPMLEKLRRSVPEGQALSLPRIHLLPQRYCRAAGYGDVASGSGERHGESAIGEETRYQIETHVGRGATSTTADANRRFDQANRRRSVAGRKTYLRRASALRTEFSAYR